MSALRRVGCVAILLLATMLVPAATPAAAAPLATDEQSGKVFIKIDPPTIQPGLTIEITASCGDDPKPARIRSQAFETSLTLTPEHGELRATLIIAAEVKPDTYRVDLRCDGGARARSELVVVDMKRPSRGPDTGGGGTSVAADDERSTGTGTLMLAAVGLAALAGSAGLLLFQRRRGR